MLRKKGRTVKEPGRRAEHSDSGAGIGEGVYIQSTEAGKGADSGLGI